MTRVALFRSLDKLVCAATALVLGGCAQLGHRDAIEALSQFQALPESNQVRYAPGAEDFARRVAALLPAATAHVEATHYRRFPAPPVVYVCSDDPCFNRFVDPRWNFAAAVVYENRLLLAPKLFERESKRLGSVLLHELSHLHMGQFRGHYSMGIPVWFHEGFASFTAHGGGADLVSDEQAWAAVAAERHFLPDEQHLPWKARRMADSWQLPVSVFYRQSLLFVRALHERDPDSFRRWVTALQDGVDFDAAFAQTYQANPARAAAAFFANGPHAAQQVSVSTCNTPLCGEAERWSHARH